MHRFTRYAAAALLTVGVAVGSAAAPAMAKDNTPGHIQNGKFVPGCTAAELTAETGGSNITDGANVGYVQDTVNGGGTVSFTFVLASKSCTELTYQVEVYDPAGEPIVDGQSTPVATSSRNGDFINSTLPVPNVTLPSSYTSDCVTLVVRSMNGATTIDRAPDGGSIDVCAGQGGGQKFA